MRLEVEAYESAQEFLDAFDAVRPGCLLLDVRMPGISGLELLERLRPRRRSLAGHRNVGLRRRADGGAGDEGRGAELPGKALPRPGPLGGRPGGPQMGPTKSPQWRCGPNPHRLERLTPGERAVLHC